MQRTLLAAAAVAALSASVPAHAADDPEIARLRAEFQAQLDALRNNYEDRLKALEDKLAATSGKADSAMAAAEQAGQAGQASGGQAAFNPEISLILQGKYAARQDGDRRPTGFLQDADIEPAERGFSLGESELIMSADIDPYFRGLANFVVGDGEVDVEEAWFQTLGLGHGLTLKGGRFISGIGYQNEQHPHAWDFADNNLMYQVLFGEHYVQDGLQLKWLAPTDTFLELGMEAGRGASFPGSGDGGDRNGAGAWALYGHVGGDVGDSSSWRAGLSWLGARPKNRDSVLLDANAVDAETAFSGTSRTWIADFVWKWAPDGNPHERNFKLQAEYFRRTETGQLACADNLADGGACDGSTGAYRGRQSGWYAQGIYQFMPSWRVGLRYDRLSNDSLDYGANAGMLPEPGYSPYKWSLMADYMPSEFSLLRLQFARNHAAEDDPDNREITLQYVYSLGPHGAHKF
ncbi:TonB-dependent receptor [Parasulfuritortus cantonensis]|uniref:TonB-dependent receptor n=1 Tax=Parasulfuritortus cantonensis TaxID=2528202 RepID=A0A4V2NW09_9PROT|nr:TonB-dependent receptor [Parasulfuritortus cantonensis]TCJ15502.1 TonB-dependent receptor [Parasulfuritortus cantonensis]